VNIAALYAMVDKADQPVDDTRETLTNLLEGLLALWETVYTALPTRCQPFSQSWSKRIASIIRKPQRDRRERRTG
jgi:hypothetical protein